MCDVDLVPVVVSLTCSCVGGLLRLYIYAQPATAQLKAHNHITIW